LRMLMQQGDKAPILTLIAESDSVEIFADASAFSSKVAVPVCDLSDASLNDLTKLKELVANVTNEKEIVFTVKGLGAICCAQTKVAVDNLKSKCLGQNADNSSSSPTITSHVEGKVFIITGAGSGFGKGIAELLFERGANIVIADINEPAALATAAELNKNSVGNGALPVIADISNGDSLQKLVKDTVAAFGGVDVLIANAGVVKAGGLTELAEKDFDFVTKINYRAYYLITKFVSEVFKIQHYVNPDNFSDIIQINSKSGLTGSNKNFAYAGSKFGGIGLTQSFALELVEFNVKVNSVCPGNFFDGPLWSDPEKGLFVQYLEAGKVEGAKTVEDVKKFYESKVPMNRGCTSIDVVKAILYIIDQKYETGQAIPVTGGQEMLK
jgi:NAD(P)-dependent dehydrogenase (short-subunit alcohol dehydrogenase family)